MTSRWSFFAFDWSRYRTMEAALEFACSTGDFTTLEVDGAADILARFDSGADPAAVSNTLVAELFGEGEVVIFETGLFETLRAIRKRPEGESMAEILSELVSTEPNIEDWFRADEGLVGILTEAQTRALHAAVSAYKPDGHSHRRRGVAALTRIFSATDEGGDRLEDLEELAARAVANNHGIGVILGG